MSQEFRRGKELIGYMYRAVDSAMESSKRAATTTAENISRAHSRESRESIDRYKEYRKELLELHPLCSPEEQFTLFEMVSHK